MNIPTRCVDPRGKLTRPQRKTILVVHIVAWWLVRRLDTCDGWQVFPLCGDGLPLGGHLTESAGAEGRR